MATVFQVTDVAVDELEIGPLLSADEGLNFVEVALMAGAEVVQSNDALVEFEQGFEQVAADKAGYAGTGLPIVSTDAGGTAQLVGPLQANYIVSKDEPDVFAAATLRLMEQPSEWAAIEQENHRTVLRFSTAVVAKMYLEAIFE